MADAKIRVGLEKQKQREILSLFFFAKLEVDLSGGGACLFFLHGDGAFADALAEVSEFRAADRSLAFDFDFLDSRRMHRKNALDALTVADATHGKGRVQPATAPADDDAGKNLDTFFVAFHDFGVDADGIADVERHRFLAELFRFNLIK
jgi:hypothetical protein